jgi:hypothetical protein
MENVMYSNPAEAAKSAQAGTGQLRSADTPPIEVIFNYLDTLNSNHENYETRLYRILVQLEGEKPTATNDEKSRALANDSSGMFPCMIAKHQLITRRSDSVFALLNDIERVLGM